MIEKIKNALTICYNFNSANTDIKLMIGIRSKDLAKFYKTYDGVEEFLDIASESEIEDALNDGAIFFEVFVDNKLAGVIKCAEITQPHPFFVAPKTIDSKKSYWGISGLYVHQDYKDRKLETILLMAGTKLAEKCNAQGIYADCDYRDQNSLCLISNFYNFLGYTYGKSRSKGELSLYTTFYKDFTGIEEEKEFFQILLDNFDLNYAKSVLDAEMKKIGPSTSYSVAYGKGINQVVCFDKPYKFRSSKILLKPFEQFLLNYKSLDIYLDL